MSGTKNFIFDILVDSYLECQNRDHIVDISFNNNCFDAPFTTVFSHLIARTSMNDVINAAARRGFIGGFDNYDQKSVSQVIDGSLFLSTYNLSGAESYNSKYIEFGQQELCEIELEYQPETRDETEAVKPLTREDVIEIFRELMAEVVSDVNDLKELAKAIQDGSHALSISSDEDFEIIGEMLEGTFLINHEPITDVDDTHLEEHLPEEAKSVIRDTEVPVYTARSAEDCVADSHEFKVEGSFYAIARDGDIYFLIPGNYVNESLKQELDDALDLDDDPPGF